MPRRGPTNLYDRQQNQKALKKKKRAKNKHKENLEGGNLDQLENKKKINGLPAGLILEARNGLFKVMVNNEVFDAKLDSHLPFEYAGYIVVGDKVAIDLSENDTASVIEARHPRTSYLSRMRGDSTRFSSFADEEHVVAANVDIGVIVATAAEPEFHPNLVDRYLIIAENGGVSPVICLNKSDLTNERPEILAHYRDKLNIPVLEVSAKTGKGIEELKQLLRHKIAVLVGNSGVGKSTITNLFNPDLDLKTQQVSAKNQEGRHTTTATSMYEWAPGSFIIDTPGIRSLGIGHIKKESLKYYFTEFEAYETDCKYNDCVHDHEPEEDCGVKQAVQAGKINQYRYESYKRMLEDLV